MSFKYSTGGFHPAPDKTFNDLNEVWAWVHQLQEFGVLQDIVCISSEDKDGEILSAPYDNFMIVGIVEEDIPGCKSGQPRRWILS